MGITRNMRREFLRNMCCVAAGGGASALFPQLRMMGTALASTSALSGYKALVCVYLNGGNDAWNMLVPYDDARFGVYTTSRSGSFSQTSTGLGLDKPTGANIAKQQINDLNFNSGIDSSNQYFLNQNLAYRPAAGANPEAPLLNTLFNSQKLAFVVNVGTLVQPIIMSDYNNPSKRPPQLFSHSDQTNQWHQANTSVSQPVGWGGKLAENLAGQGANTSGVPALPLAISIAGSTRFEIGNNTVPYQISSNGLTTLSGVCSPKADGTLNCGTGTYGSVRDFALKSLLEDTFQNDFATGYGTVLQHGRDLYKKIGPDLSTTTVTTTFPSNSSLASQLQTVAKMIKLSKTKGYAQRQIYFVQLGGFDLHANMMSGGTNHGTLLALVGNALKAFYDCLGETGIGAQSEVTTFTVSDFARTLQSNGSGSDHAWGSVQMVMGGAVNGGKLYSDGGGLIKGFPNQALNAPNSFSRGQTIPGIGVEQYSATLAQWMGVSQTDCLTMFPNLHNFSSTNLGFV